MGTPPRNSNVTILSYNGMMPKLADNVYLSEGVRIIGDVEIGKASSIWFNTVMRGDVNYIRIGERSNIQDNSVIHVTHNGNPTLIGDDVTVGHNCVIHACTIKNLCLIGMGAIVMDGAVIGEESIVGAGSIVTQGKSFPARSLIIGAPAKLVRTLNDEEVNSLKKSAQHYVKVSHQYLDSNT